MLYRGDADIAMRESTKPRGKSGMKDKACQLTVFCISVLAICSGVFSETHPTTPEDGLKGIQLPDVEITSVALNNTKSKDGKVQITYYDIDGVIGGTIHFELLLPEPWNKRFVMGGGGGFGGRVENVVRDSVRDGYATVGTDTGHQGEGFDSSFALDDALALVNFGHLAVHRTAEVAKAIIREHYGMNPEYSYFVGGSRGGGQGMMESQRYPDDFDGIVAGAPAFDWVGLGAKFLHVAQAFYPDPNVLDKTIVTREEVEKLRVEVIAQCDEQDGLKDGIISDPLTVKFSLDSITWLSAEQRIALQTIYDGVSNQNGQIQPGMLVGSEAEWFLWHVGPMPGFPIPTAGYACGVGNFMNLVFNDPDWDYSKYDFSNYEKDTRFATSTLSAIDADLSAFRDSGGKLIIYHGLGDGGLSPKATMNYYDRVLAGDPNANDYTRLYLIPGVGHGEGVGPVLSHAEWLEVLVDWVEAGQAPDTIIATKPAMGGRASLSRPLSPYPKRTVYKGSGDPNNASSFESVAP